MSQEQDQTPPSEETVDSSFFSRLKKTLNTDVRDLVKGEEDQAPIDDTPSHESPKSVEEVSQPDNQTDTADPIDDVSLLGRLKAGLKRTRDSFSNGLAMLGLGSKAIDEALLEELEMLLVSADIGIEATQEMIADLTERLSRNQLKDGEALLQALRENMLNMLTPVGIPLENPDKLEKPFVLLVIGVNGAGKTTTIGKLTKRLQAEGRSVMLAAGDT
ncbi:MAG: signal recognition particle receptor subunit alpha, partial [Pseudomonadota bacterium]